MTKNANRRVIVIDDNPHIHEDIRKILGPRKTNVALEKQEKFLFDDDPIEMQIDGFEVDAALQGQDGLAKIQFACYKRRPYSIAFVDIRMPPGWDGLETIERIWKADPDIQTVIFSAYL